jgi:signal transduction histidine kinase
MAETQADDWLVGGGEMGRLMRGIDWSKTALGPTSTWPQALKTSVSICLGSRHPIVLWWRPERFMFYNDGYRPMLGERKHPQFLGRPGEECWSEIWNIIGPMMDQVIATGEATWSEDLFLLMLRHGYLEETYFTFSYSPIRDERGVPRGIFNACAESTPRVLADRRLRALRGMAVDARTVADASRRCAEALGQSAQDMPFALIYLYDASAQKLELSAAFGLAPGTPASPPAVEAGDDASRGWPLFEVATSGRSAIVTQLPSRFDCLPLAPWDEAAHEAMVLPLARAGTEQPAGVLVLGISPRRAFDDAYRGFFELVAGHVATAIGNARAYAEERERAEALAAIDRAKTAFFSNVSHEFRTPLTLILGPLEDAIESDARKLDGESLLAVHRSALRLLRLVNTLLDFSRVEAGRVQASFEPTDLALITAGLAGSFQSLIEGAGLKLDVRCPPLPEPVFVDRGQWEKIVLNLISNAFKFTFQGEIGVELAWLGDRVELRVRDTGTGIPEQELTRVFERFHRVEGARGRSFEGTGIGLALVHELTKLHGGSVSVSSTLGEGTTFVVSVPTGKQHLPAEQIVEARSSREPAVRNAHLLEAAHWGAELESELVDSGVARAVDLADATGAKSVKPASARILVADDNADMREYLARLLGAFWRVEVVPHGKAALGRARAEPPDLILSDVMMPEMDGVALLRELRADASTRTIPIILLSARAGEEAVLSGLDTGADDYLVKPFSARELLTRVRTHLEMQRVRRDAASALRELADARAVLVEELERKNADIESAYRELKRTHSQLVQSAKMASLGVLVAGVAHEINNPLAYTLGHLDTAQKSLGEVGQKMSDSFGFGEANQPWSRALDRLSEMRNGLERIRGLVIRLRTFSRLDEGEYKTASIQSSVESVLAILGHRFINRVEVVTDFGEPDEIECYPGLLNQALMNLVANAVDAIDGEGRVRISTGVEGDHYFIRVADTGAGIPEAIRDRLFEPFFTTKPVGAGVGLGLSITYSIVKKHGGELALEPGPGTGTVASIRLPWPPASRRGS